MTTDSNNNSSSGDASPFDKGQKELLDSEHNVLEFHIPNDIVIEPQHARILAQLFDEGLSAMAGRDVQAICLNKRIAEGYFSRLLERTRFVE